MLIEAHPDSRGPTDQIRFRHKAPVTAVRAVVAVVAHHEVLSRRNNPGCQLLPWLLVIHPHLVLRNRHCQNSVRHITQCLFTLGKTNSIFFGFVFRHFKESAGRFPTITA
ncbi:Uncharacterised protein [Shigella flexneri]|nr:Uncharacterised protein [Shigella flexneri]